MPTLARRLLSRSARSAVGFCAGLRLPFGRLSRGPASGIAATGGEFEREIRQEAEAILQIAHAHLLDEPGPVERRIREQ